MAGQELNVLAVAILGGASLVGGVGTVGGVVLGILFLAILQNGLNLLGVSSYFFGVVIGLAILVSIAMTGFSDARGRRTREPRWTAPCLAWPTRRSPDCDRLLAGCARRAGGIGGLLALLVALVALLRARRCRRPFRRGTTLQAMMFQLPELGLLSLAMAIPLISGGINLAIIATANQCALLMAWILTALMPPSAGGPRSRSGFVGALVAGLAPLRRRRPRHRLAGRVHRRASDPGHARHHVAAPRRLSIYFTRGTHRSPASPTRFLASERTLSCGIPVSFLSSVAGRDRSSASSSTRTPLGIRIHMIGSNLEATRYLRHRHAPRPGRGLHSLQPALLARRGGDDGPLQLGQRRYAQSYLLITILAAILGGIDPFGGFGRISGLLIALVMLQVIASGSTCWASASI